MSQVKTLPTKFAVTVTRSAYKSYTEPPGRYQSTKTPHTDLFDLLLLQKEPKPSMSSTTRRTTTRSTQPGVCSLNKYVAPIPQPLSHLPETPRT